MSNPAATELGKAYLKFKGQVALMALREVRDSDVSRKVDLSEDDVIGLITLYTNGEINFYDYKSLQLDILFEATIRGQSNQ